MTVTELVVRAQRGDEEAFARLVEVHMPRAAATARFIMGDSAAAEDPLQEAFVQAWRSLPKLRDPERFSAWLRRLVVTRCLNHRRAARRLQRAVSSLRYGTQSAPSPEAGVAQRDELDRALAMLTMQQRAILALRYGEDLTSAEIGQVLGIPAGTARSRLHHAIAGLRKAMEAQRDAIATDVAREST